VFNFKALKKADGLLPLLLCVLLFAAGSAAAGQARYRVGILSGIDGFAPMGDGFIARMAELGYLEGKDVVYDFRKTNADPAAAQKAIDDFVAAKVDLIYAFPSAPAMLAKLGTAKNRIPVVFSCATLEGTTLIANPQKPGGNITGVRYPAPELTVKRFELLQEFLPGLRRLVIFYDSKYPANPSALEALRSSARAAGVKLLEHPVTTVAELERAVKCAKPADCSADALLIMPDLLTQAPRGWPALSGFAARRNIPIAGSANFQTDSGALFSLIPDNIETGRIAAEMAAKILHGVPPGTLAVENPEARLTISYKQARKLGISVPPGLLSRADRIIR